MLGCCLSVVSEGIVEFLHGVFVTLNIHDWNTWHLSNSPFEILIICRYHVTSVGLHLVDEAVICVCSLVLAGEFLEARVLGQLESKPEPMAHFLQLCNNTIGDTRNRFGQETIHH